MGFTGKIDGEEAKMDLLAKKVRVTFFWVKRAINHIGYFQKERRINGERCSNLLNRLNHQNNARVLPLAKLLVGLWIASSTLFSGFSPQWFFSVSNLEKTLCGKKFGSCYEIFPQCLLFKRWFRSQKLENVGRDAPSYKPQKKLRWMLVKGLSRKLKHFPSLHGLFKLHS